MLNRSGGLAVSTQWLDKEQTILGYIFEANWTWEEMAAAIQQANTLMDTISYPVDFVADSRGVSLILSDVITNI